MSDNSLNSIGNEIGSLDDAGLEFGAVLHGRLAGASSRPLPGGENQPPAGQDLPLYVLQQWVSPIAAAEIADPQPVTPEAEWLSLTNSELELEQNVQLSDVSVDSAVIELDYTVPAAELADSDAVPVLPVLNGAVPVIDDTAPRVATASEPGLPLDAERELTPAELQQLKAARVVQPLPEVTANIAREIPVLTPIPAAVVDAGLPRKPELAAKGPLNAPLAAAQNVTQSGSIPTLTNVVADEVPVPGLQNPAARAETSLTVTATQNPDSQIQENLQQFRQVFNNAANPVHTPQIPVVSQPARAEAADTLLAPAGTHSSLIDLPVDSDGWGERVGERLIFMAGNQVKAAEIRLTPAELGPLRVQISVDDGNVNVSFHAQHAVTREAIEQALPRLRELFAENGLTLTESSVGEQGVAEQGNSGEQEYSEDVAGLPGSDDAAVSDAEEKHARPRLAQSSGLVDTFV